MKVCKLCRQPRPFERFSRHSKGNRGYRTTCKDCLNAKARRARQENPEEAQRVRARWRAWYAQQKVANPSFLDKEWAREKARRDRLKAADPAGFAAHQRQILRASRLRRSFALSVEQYEAMLRAQDGKCAVCRRPETIRRNGVLLNLAVDHDHETGKVRGLLCCQCNNGIGRFSDDPALLRAAAGYLESRGRT